MQKLKKKINLRSKTAPWGKKPDMLYAFFSLEKEKEENNKTLQVSQKAALNTSLGCQCVSKFLLKNVKNIL